MLSVPHLQILALREWTKKQHQIVTRETIDCTKGWKANEMTSGLTQKDEERIRKMYQVPPTINIMIPISKAKDSNLSPEGWIAFHEKRLWLRLRFPMYPYVRKFFIRTQLVPSQLLTNE